ncbi:hypothetical protein K6L09_27330, partial [Burkholderia cepacia]
IRVLPPVLLAPLRRPSPAPLRRPATASDLLLGAGGECIEIFIGDEMEPIRGTINRTSNLNKTPRVFGGRELQQRFQELSESTLMVVEVLSPTSIRIRVVQPAG